MNVEIVDQVWWYTSRSAGIVGWVLLSASMIAGMSMSVRDQRVPRTSKLDLHRFFSTLSLIFISLHLVALVPDNFVHFGLIELFVPFESEWQPEEVAWGVIAFWLLVSVELTSLLRTRIPNRLWKIIHTLAFVVWALATVHLFVAGTDVGHPLFRVVQATVMGAVLATFVYRVAIMIKRRSSRRRTASVEESVHVDQIDPGERRELATRRGERREDVASLRG